MCTFWCLIHYLIFKKQRNRNLILNHEIRNRFQTIFQIILCPFIYQILIAFECLHLKKNWFSTASKNCCKSSLIGFEISKSFWHKPTPFHYFLLRRIVCMESTEQQEVADRKFARIASTSQSWNDLLWLPLAINS